MWIAVANARGCGPESAFEIPALRVSRCASTRRRPRGGLDSARRLLKDAADAEGCRLVRQAVIVDPENQRPFELCRCAAVLPGFSIAQIN
jgi:hypothetical protein